MLEVKKMDDFKYMHLKSLDRAEDEIEWKNK